MVPVHRHSWVFPVVERSDGARSHPIVRHRGAHCPWTNAPTAQHSFTCYPISMSSEARAHLLEEARRQGREAAARHAHDSWVAEKQGEHIPPSEESPPDDDPELRDAWIRGWYDYEADE